MARGIAPCRTSLGLIGCVNHFDTADVRLRRSYKDADAARVFFPYELRVTGFGACRVLVRRGWDGMAALGGGTGGGG